MQLKATVFYKKYLKNNNKKSVFLYNTMIKRQTATIYKS